MMKKTFTAALAAATLAGVVMTSTTSAEARWGHRGYYGGAIAAGVIGALAVGAIAASAAQPVYACSIERRPVFNAYGYQVGWRRVRVC